VSSREKTQEFFEIVFPAFREAQEDRMSESDFFLCWMAPAKFQIAPGLSVTKLRKKGISLHAIKCEIEWNEKRRSGGTS
jgi:hypothetical protein